MKTILPEEVRSKLVAKMKGITKFTIEDPSLNEIFISIVGENYEK